MTIIYRFLIGSIDTIKLKIFRYIRLKYFNLKLIRMKKFILLFCLLATSCVFEHRYSYPIEYQVTIQNMESISLSRTTEIKDLTKVGDLWVNIVRDNGSVLGQTSVYYSGGRWHQGIGQEHPNVKLHHYCVVPKHSFTLDNKKMSIEHDTIDNTDLIVAYATTTNTSMRDATAKLQFKHALAEINFAVQGAEDLEITISNIEIDGIYTKGKYTFGEGWLEDEDSYKKQIYEADNNIDVIGDKIHYLTTDGVDPDNGGAENSLMVIPQKHRVVISFNYSIYYDGKPLVEKSFMRELLNEEWLAGNRYLYVISFNTYPVPINYEPTIIAYNDSIIRPIEI